MPAVSRWIVACLVAVTAAVPGFADERSEAIARQKAAAEARLDSAKQKLALAETDDLLLFADVPAERMKAVSDDVQRSYATAAKTLGYGGKDTPWTGKLAVFVISGSRAYKDFILHALNRQPDAREQVVMELRGETPFLVVGLDSDKPGERRIASDASVQVAATLLSRKAGVGRSSITFALPEWLRNGFGQAVYVRSAGGKRLSDHQQRVRAYLRRTRGTAFQGAAVWGDLDNPQRDLSGASLAEYLAFGPPSARFPAFLAGFKPQDDNSPAPGIEAVLGTMDWKLEELETGWRRWVLTGK